MEIEAGDKQVADSDQDTDNHDDFVLKVTTMASPVIMVEHAHAESTCYTNETECDPKSKIHSHDSRISSDPKRQHRLGVVVDVPCRENAYNWDRQIHYAGEDEPNTVPRLGRLIMLAAIGDKQVAEHSKEDRINCMLQNLQPELPPAHLVPVVVILRAEGKPE